MKLLYFDCFAGIAGDMTVAALIELGLPLKTLQRELSRLPLAGYTLKSEKVERHGVAGTSFKVACNEKDQPHRHYQAIAAMIGEAPLKPRVKELAGRIFLKLAEAEAAVHGVPLERVHFHEVGAIDSIVDIVGTAIGIDHLGIDRVTASALPWGRGFVKTAHGLLPVPAPATARLMEGIPVGPDVGEGERVTPTGAAIVAALADSFGPPPAMTVSATGYGAGEKDFPELPNLLRLVVGESAGPAAGEQVLVLETHIDDMPAEIFGFLMERLIEAGALDVAFSPLQMKKNRPGTRLTVIARPADLKLLSGIVLAESSALGLRYYPAGRIVLPRRGETRQTALGTVAVKVSGDGRVTPEYESCRAIALEKGMPLIEVYRIAERECGRG